MSLKAGHLILVAGTMLAASVAAWHQNEQQRRKTKGEQDRDTQRNNMIEHTLDEVDSLCQDIDMLRSALQAASHDQHLGVEVTAYAQKYAVLKEQLKDFRDRLQQQQQAFQAATRKWEKEPLTYQNGHFDSLDVESLHDAARHLVQSGETLRQRLAEHREAAWLQKQEQENTQKAVQTARERLQARLAELDQLPHTTLAPGSYAAVIRQIAEIDRQIAQQSHSAAYESTLQTIDQVHEIHQRVQTTLIRWQEQHIAAQRAYRKLQYELRAVDQEFLAHWAAPQWQNIQQDVSVLGQHLTTLTQPTTDEASFKIFLSRIEQVQHDLAATDVAAQQQYEIDVQRKALVTQLVEVLEELDFSVDAELEDAQNPRSEVIIKADRSSGQEVQMVVDMTHHIELKMDDGIKGADCVQDVRQIIAKLRETGVELNIDDWGDISPERLEGMESKEAPRSSEMTKSNQQTSAGQM
jgi:hypothetical protein